MPRPFFTPGKDPVFIVQAGWAPGLVWTGAEYFVPTRIRYPGHPARSQSLYQLRYPAHFSLQGAWVYSNVFTNIAKFLSFSTNRTEGCQVIKYNELSVSLWT
jgi:hypothetical protein